MRICITLRHSDLTVSNSGGGTVDFQEFVGGLSAFSSRGGREEKLRCAYGILKSCFAADTLSSCLQSIRHGPRWFHLKRRTLLGLEDDGGKQLESTQNPRLL